MGQGWNWSGFFDYLFNLYILGGVVTTVWLTLAAIVGGMMMGTVLALARLSSRVWLN